MDSRITSMSWIMLSDWIDTIFEHLNSKMFKIRNYFILSLTITGPQRPVLKIILLKWPKFCCKILQNWLFLIVIDHGYNSVRFKWEAVWKQILKVFFLD